MTRENQSELLAEFYAEKKNVLKLKGEDYANEDVLSNFKSAGANIGISAELQCLSLIATKVARLGNLLSGKKPNNESVADSILDLSNYTDLLYCLVNEKKEQKKHLVEIMQSDEKDGLYELRTKRWENIAPHPMLDVIANMNKTIQAGAEWHKKRREEAETISEPYVPKVGDKFINQEDEIFTIVLTRDERVIYRYKKSSMLDVNSLEREQFLEKIRKGVFKRVN